MIIKFKFADGTVSEVEVDEELGLVISAMEREEQSYERKMRRWAPIKLDGAEYEGEWFADNNTPMKAYELEESQRRVDEFKKLLTPTQLRRLKIREDNPGISLREIARMEGTQLKAIEDTFEQIKKKYKKFFG